MVIIVMFSAIGDWYPGFISVAVHEMLIIMKWFPRRPNKFDTLTFLHSKYCGRGGSLIMMMPVNRTKEKVEYISLSSYFDSNR